MILYEAQKPTDHNSILQTTIDNFIKLQFLNLNKLDRVYIFIWFQ